MRTLLLRLMWSASIWLSATRAFGSETNGSPDVAFSRIIHGWTNYSTAFNTTHDTGAGGEYATVASLYTPASDVRLCEYASIVIWGGMQVPRFSNFEFRVFVWSSLEVFIREPQQADVASWSFTAPTGGSTSVPDTTTRGGRPAYELRFNLTNAPVVLSNAHTYVIGFTARTDTQRNGELYVPTSSHDGLSDVQAGNLVVGGWQYLVDAGGSTIYSGQLAVELIVTPGPPRMDVERVGDFVRISWPASAQGFVLEYAFNLSSTASWLPVEIEPSESDGRKEVLVPASFARQWFRLKK
jgi:hypothetical protein